ncbi:MAG: beta-N-acetylhexosaminidase [Flavobacteriaceae bacterium]
MKPTRLIAVLCLCFFISKSPAQSVNLIPQPQSLELAKGVFDRNAQVNFSTSGGNLSNELQFLTALFPNENTTGKPAQIKLKIDASMDKPESYDLQISSNEINISGADAAGVFYGIQTLHQIILQNPKELPALKIQDAPRFAYRGMHLDVGRHFFDLDYLKTYVDMIAMHKMNRFHWHLTEDQGWRIEIKKYPKLTEIGAYRDQTIMGRWSSRAKRNPSFDNKPYGGFYTQDEVKELVAYAQKRHIVIVPEIEMPGHALAAVTAYPELGNTKKQYKVAQKWGVFPQIYEPSEQTFTFLEDVLTEVMELFPGEYIHIGGDEAPKTQWEQSEFAQNLIKEKGLKDEHGLQSYFIGRIEKFLNANGRQIIGWDEILEGGLAPNATVMSWRGEQGGIEAAKQQHKVIMTPTNTCYFDYYQAEPVAYEPLAIGGYVPVKTVYDYEPIPRELSKKEAQYIQGAQGNVWTEYMKTPEQVNYMVLPRMTALSEVVWSSPKEKDYVDFVKRLQSFQLMYQNLGVNYAHHIIERNE